MMDDLSSDWILQAAMFAVACVFAVVMRYALHNGSAFTTLIFQGLIIVSALVVISSAFHPQLFQSIYNQRSIMLIPAMMTLIYAARDALSGGSARKKPDRSHTRN